MGVATKIPIQTIIDSVDLVFTLVGQEFEIFQIT